MPRAKKGRLHARGKERRLLRPDGPGRERGDVVSVMYDAVRANPQFSVNRLARVVSKSTEGHWNRLKHATRYFKAHPRWVTDSDWAANMMDRESVTSVVAMVGGHLIHTSALVGRGGVCSQRERRFGRPGHGTALRRKGSRPGWSSARFTTWRQLYCGYNTTSMQRSSRSPKWKRPSRVPDEEFLKVLNFVEMTMRHATSLKAGDQSADAFRQGWNEECGWHRPRVDDRQDMST